MFILRLVMDRMYLWFDKWNEHGPIAQYISRRERYDARMSDDITVAQMVLQYQWKWPNEWYERFPSLQQIQKPMLQNDKTDEGYWIDNDGKKGQYLTKQVWRDIRPHRAQVLWHHVVWFPLANPKHAFILWLTIQNRLVTQDKLQIWYPNQIYKCPLCEQCNDSIRHLFFQCKYAKKIWAEMKNRIVFKGLSDEIGDIVEKLAGYTKHIWNVLNR